MQHVSKLLTKDAIVWLQHIAIAGDLQRVFIICHDHDGLHGDEFIAVDWRCIGSKGILCGANMFVLHRHGATADLQAPQKLVCSPILGQLYSCPSQLPWMLL